MGELSAMEWLASKGAHIYVPVGHSPDIDLIAEINGHPLRVEVKTATHRNSIGRWEAMIATRGGNQSWNGVAKYFDANRCDYLFVHVGDGRRWFIPSLELDAKAGITLGGPKYAEFEVEPGRPLIAETDEPGLESDEPGEYRSGQPGHPVKVLAYAFAGSNPASPTDGNGDGMRPAVGRTRVSSSHQITIPSAPFEVAGISVGDRFRVEATGLGELRLIRLAEYSQQHREQLALKTDP